MIKTEWFNKKVINEKENRNYISLLEKQNKKCLKTTDMWIIDFSTSNSKIENKINNYILMASKDW